MLGDPRVRPRASARRRWRRGRAPAFRRTLRRGRRDGAPGAQRAEQGLWLRRLADDYANFGAALAWARDALRPTCSSAPRVRSGASGSSAATCAKAASGSTRRCCSVRRSRPRRWAARCTAAARSPSRTATSRRGVRSRSSVSASLARSTTTPRWRVPGRACERRRHAVHAGGERAPGAGGRARDPRAGVAGMRGR